LSPWAYDDHVGDKEKQIAASFFSSYFSLLKLLKSSHHNEQRIRTTLVMKERLGQTSSYMQKVLDGAISLA